MAACERKESAIAIPEASSAAELILRPELSLLKDLSSSLALTTEFACAFNAPMLVFILNPILNPFKILHRKD